MKRIIKMVRPTCCDKLNARKGGWVEEKEATRFPYLSKHGSANWSSIPRKTGQKRCGKNCRLRWNSNYLRHEVSQEGFTQQEEELIIKLHAAVGTRWGLIAHQFPGRTENDIKIHWNTKLRKKLTEMGIDPITHKPFSQILADYGNIGGLSRSSDTPKHIGTIRKDLKKSNTFNFPKQQSTISHSYSFLSDSQMSENISSIENNNYGNNTINHSNNNNHSLDLLSQLQAITLVTEGPNSEINLPSNYNSSDLFSISSNSVCSPNYTNNAGQYARSPECFSWHDFLLDEAFKPAQNQGLEQEGNNLTEFMSINSTGNDEVCAVNQTRVTTSDGSSFLEAMLDQENDMFLTFPGLMEEPLY